MCWECKIKVTGWLPCTYICKEGLLRLCFPELSLAEPGEAGVEVAESKAGGVCCDKSVIAAFLLLPVHVNAKVFTALPE